MSNPKFECQNEPSKDFLELTKDNTHVYFHVYFHQLGSRFPKVICCSKLQVQKIIDQLQSWLDTGEFIKPKKRYVAVYLPSDACGPEKPWAHIIDSPEDCQKNAHTHEVYELTDSNRVK